MFYFLFMLINSLLYGKSGGPGKPFSLGVEGSSHPLSKRTTTTATAVAPPAI